jgi:hypothetical protein
MDAALSFSIFWQSHNRDGSWESICTKCHQTVASAATEDELSVIEQSHNCGTGHYTEHRNWQLTEFPGSLVQIRRSYVFR